ncbi:4Fe-4S binding protein [Candidatus Bathyarchaeota archaeon]|nr:4Fe-4S binding protein [Candidatus Bathyarchaeota archaeon]
MSEIKTIQSIVFSPTGTTRQIVDRVSKSIGVEAVDTIDLTLPKSRDEWTGEVTGDLLLVGVPTYYDTIPSITLNYLSKLQGKGKWALPITVYGNVSPGACLQELCGLLKFRGFRLLAAANFVAENSFASKDLPLAIGRPDDKDLYIAYNFGKMVREKINSNLVEAEVDVADLMIGQNYTRKIEEYPENNVINLARVEFNESNCIRCFSCVEVCPIGAIDSESLTINDGLCFRCFACTRVCPSEALKPVIVKDIVDYFQTLLDKRQEPSLYI